MDENQDCREEIINKLAVWATSGIDDVREAKCDLYLLLSDVEITSRHTKVFSVQEDRNEYLLENFLLAKQVKGCTDKTLFGNGMFTADLMQSNRKMWKYNLIWEKTQPTGFLNAKKMPLRSHEDICVFYKKLPTYNPQKTIGHSRKVSKAEHKINCKETTDYGKYKLTTYDSTERYPKSVWRFAKDIQKEAFHPTQKPVALLEYIIKTYTNENDLVLDNCMGSGSTGVACININRDFIGMELEEEYFEIAKKRMYLSFMKENYKKSSEFWEELAKRKDLDDKYKY